MFWNIFKLKKNNLAYQIRRLLMLTFEQCSTLLIALFLWTAEAGVLEVDKSEAFPV